MRNGEEHFAQALMRKSISQILYAQAQRQATRPPRFMRASARLRPVHADTLHVTRGVSDALSDITAALIETIARSAASRAHLAARSKSTLLDAHAALTQLAPTTHVTARDLARYAMLERVPFPHVVPAFPVLASAKRRSELLEERGRKRSYVEAWMPTVPPMHTYVATETEVGRGGKRAAGGVHKALAGLEGGERLARAVPENPFLKVPRVGGWTEGEVREVVEVEEVRESNREGVKSSANEQKRHKVDRILAEGGGTAVGGAGGEG